jgi:hypothetical protein
VGGYIRDVSAERSPEEDAVRPGGHPPLLAGVVTEGVRVVLVELVSGGESDGALPQVTEHPACPHLCLALILHGIRGSTSLKFDGSPAIGWVGEWVGPKRSVVITPQACLERSHIPARSVSLQLPTGSSGVMGRPSHASHASSTATDPIEAG